MTFKRRHMNLLLPSVDTSLFAFLLVGISQFIHPALALLKLKQPIHRNPGLAQCRYRLSATELYTRMPGALLKERQQMRATCSLAAVIGGACEHHRQQVPTSCRHLLSSPHSPQSKSAALSVLHYSFVIPDYLWDTDACIAVQVVRGKKKINGMINFRLLRSGSLRAHVSRSSGVGTCYPQLSIPALSSRVDIGKVGGVERPASVARLSTQLSNMIHLLHAGAVPFGYVRNMSENYISCCDEDYITRSMSCHRLSETGESYSDGLLTMEKTRYHGVIIFQLFRWLSRVGDTGKW